MDDASRLLRLLQITDSGFPTGAFAFSQGLEGLCEAGAIHGEGDVAAFVAMHLDEGFAGIECPAMAWSWRAASERDLSGAIDVDRLIQAFKPVPAFRSGSIRTGRGLLHSTAGIVSGPVLDGLRERVLTGDANGHHAVVFGVAMEAAGIDERSAALALGAGFVAGLTAAAVRLGIIGQNAAQRIVAASHPSLAASAARGVQTPLEDLGAFTPAIDVAGLRQPRLPGRIFAS
jgi:urease accessory protein